MRERSFWIQKIHSMWQKKSILWLSGVRRSGKTTLCSSLPEVHLYDCELRSVRERLADPEDFFKNVTSRAIALDEIHKLADPANVLKIASDHFPHLKVIATGSSTLDAAQKFSDTLTDRKRSLWLTPMNFADMHSFQHITLEDRLMKGGLPPFACSESFDETGYQDWIESFWAKDIQELFHVEKRYSFLKLVELIALQSGSLFEATRFASPCEISRQTVNNFLSILEVAHVAHVIRPYSTNPAKEIIAAPKVYFFDTGFITYFNGWSELHAVEKGIYWEHLVLNELYCHFPKDEVLYWRDKKKNEVDFILKRRGKNPIAIECKWKSSEFDPRSLVEFRKSHAGDQNFILCADVKTPRVKKFGSLSVTFMNYGHLATVLP